MSVFRVRLNNIDQGQLDLDPSTNSSTTYGQVGVAFGTHNSASGDYSKQRQVYVMGPKKINRLLVDGATFTDCNYWKRFAYPQTTREFAFIEVVTDDGSVYSDIASENTFAVGGSYTLAAGYTDANTIDFVTTHGGPAKFLQIQASGATVTAELNGDTDVVFTIASGSTQVFNTGDLAITQIRMKGSGATATIVGSVASAINS